MGCLWKYDIPAPKLDNNSVFMIESNIFTTKETWDLGELFEERKVNDIFLFKLLCEVIQKEKKIERLVFPELWNVLG